MKIQSDKSPVFGAKLISSNTKIGKFFKAVSQYKEYDASFIEIQPENQFDILALENVAKYWGNDDKYAANIYHAATEMQKNKSFAANKIYALTSQKSNYNKLDDCEILGLVLVKNLDKKSIHIEHKQVNPTMIYFAQPEYKGIGSGIINALQEIYDKISCKPEKSKSVIDFYLKNGFRKTLQNSNILVWSKN